MAVGRALQYRAIGDGPDRGDAAAIMIAVVEMTTAAIGLAPTRSNVLERSLWAKMQAGT